MLKPWGASLSLILMGLIAAGCRDSKSLEITSEACAAQTDFVFIAGGAFLSGSDRTEKDYAYRISAAGRANATTDTLADIARIEAGYRKQGWFDQEPNRQISTLPPFCLSKNLTTNADYQAFVQATGYAAPGISKSDYQKQGFLVHDYSTVEPYLWQNDQYPTDQGQHPVVLISYEDALAYIAWRSQQGDVSYRLPTATEWEKAARGTDGRYFPWGNEWQNEATNWAKNGPYGTSGHWFRRMG